jgi:hypothetical protein
VSNPDLRETERERERRRERERDLFSDVAKSGNKNVKSMRRVEKACCRMLGFVIQRANGDNVGRAHLNCKLCARL